MSEKTWVLDEVDASTRHQIVEAAAEAGLSVANYLTQILALEAAPQDNLAAESVAEEEPAASPFAADPSRNFAVTHRLKVVERRTSRAIGGLDEALHVLDGAVFGLSARVDDAEALAQDTAQTLSLAQEHLETNTEALRRRLIDAEHALEDLIETSESAEAAQLERYGALDERLDAVEHTARHAATAHQHETLARHVGVVEAVARNAEHNGATLLNAHEALKRAVADDFSIYVQQTTDELSLELEEIRTVSELASQQADAAIAKALAEMRAAREALEVRFEDTAAELNDRIDAAFTESANFYSALADRVADGERAQARNADQLLRQICDVEDGAQAAIEENTQVLRTAQQGLAADLEAATREHRAAIESARFALVDAIETRTADLSAELAEVRDRQSGGLTRLRIVDTAVSGLVADVAALRETLNNGLDHVAAEARESVAALEIKHAHRLDWLMDRLDETRTDAVGAREGLAQQFKQFEARTLDSLQRAEADRERANNAMAIDLEEAANSSRVHVEGMRQRLEAELGDLRAQHAGLHARLNDFAKPADIRDLASNVEAKQHAANQRLAKLEADIDARALDRAVSARLDRLDAAVDRSDLEQAMMALQGLFTQLETRVDEKADDVILARIEDLRARLAAQEAQAADAADRVHGVARMLGRVTAHSADASTQSEDRLHKLELAVADMRLENFSAAPAQAAAPSAAPEALAQLEQRLAEMEQRQADALEGVRADIAHFLGESDRRLSALEENHDAEDTAGAGVALLKLAASLDARFAELEHRDLSEYDGLRRRIEERILQVEQKSIRALEQLSESVALLTKRSEDAPAKDAPSRAAG